MPDGQAPVWSPSGSTFKETEAGQLLAVRQSTIYFNPRRPDEALDDKAIPPKSEQIALSRVW